MTLVVNNLSADAGEPRDVGFIPGSGRPPGGGHGNPHQSSMPGESHRQRSLVDYSMLGCRVRHDCSNLAHTLEKQNSTEKVGIISKWLFLQRRYIGG